MATLTMHDLLSKIDRHSTDESGLMAIREVAEDISDALKIWTDGLANFDEETLHHFLCIATGDGAKKAEDILWNYGTLRDVIEDVGNADEYADW